MKTEKNILIAFILNLAFSIFEFFGGVFTGSVAIISDAVHDIGDAGAIGVSFFLERKSKKSPDEKYTYGYARYSLIGALFTTLILLVGSAVMIYNAIFRILNPTEIKYNGMIIFAIIGVCVNFCAAYFTREGDSLNQKAVNLHMLEDVLGWAIVLIGAIVMRFTDFWLIDPIMSIGLSAFILINSLKNLKEGVDLILEKAPSDISVSEIIEHLKHIDGVLDVHHLHLWSMDGQNNFATMHVVTDEDAHEIKDAIREELLEHGVGHITIEIESSCEHCHYKECRIESASHLGHHHHHHHHAH